MEKRKRRTSTSPGLGVNLDSGLRPRHVDAVTPGSALSDTMPSLTSDHPLETNVGERAEKISTLRARAKVSRPPVRIDDVGDVAVAIASRRFTVSTPKLLKTRGELTEAPIDHRDAFVLSLIDGKMTFPVLVDVSGMPEAEITRILDKLARLGIVSLA
jgi:hypothetical protein